VELPPRNRDEDARLLALRSYSVLDTNPEPAFDDLARIAARIMDAPIALVSFVDEERQWFKARYGLDVAETSRDVSFCGHVVANETRVVVPDAHQDPRFADNPLVLGAPKVRFYAGIPLTTAEGFTLGSLCAIDHNPRQPSEEDLKLLELLAKQVVEQLEARRGRLELAKERREAHDAAARLAAVLETMADGVVLQNTAGSIVGHNRAASEILGLREIEGRTSTDPGWRAVHEDGRPFPGEEHPAMVTLNTGIPQRGVVMGLPIGGGETTWISINSMPRLVGGKVAEVVSTFHDISALKNLTERASQQERLATIGTLVAGIGHEINNPLAYVLGNLDFALDELREIAGPSPSNRLRETITSLVESRVGAERIRKIVRGLRALAREDVALSSIDVASVVDCSLGMAVHETRHRAEVVVELEEEVYVLGDESRLAQVMVNLIVNAAQAFEKDDLASNRITVSARKLTGGKVLVEVSDNGPGVPVDLQRRVFDPFFTTKPVGIGTGLGLSVSRTIVTTLGGELSLRSTPGAGTTFTLLLAGASDLPQVPGEAAPPVSPLRARVLIVDDEPAVANSVRRLLTKEHDVTVFTDPREALAAMRATPAVDLILCDLMMPHLSGQDLYRQAGLIGADLQERFVFITGGATNPEVRAFLEQVSNERLEKPFSAENLLRMARRYAKRPPKAT
jgi:PAS domain S-box-containing protein